MKKFLFAAIVALLALNCGAQNSYKWKITKQSRPELRDSLQMHGLKAGECWNFTLPVKDVEAGSYVEFDLVVGSEPDSPKYFMVEYLDGRQWKPTEGRVYPVPENPKLKYNVKCTGIPNQTFTVLQTFRLKKAIKEGELKMRLRVIGDYSCSGGKLSDGGSRNMVRMMPYGYIGGYARVLGTQTPVDTLRVGWLGNSFTFVNAADFILKELAFYEGHYLDMHVNYYPGAYFRSHILMPASLDVLSEGGYDWFILQDQSTQAARYGRDEDRLIIDYASSVASLIRYFSPECKIAYEQTWAFSMNDYSGFGGFEYFDKCSSKGAKAISEKIEAAVSPIAKAFAVVRSERPDIEIYSTDFHHPAAYGAYLKACCDYLVIFGEPFTSDKADFALDSKICAYLRQVAQKVCCVQ